MTVVFGSLIQPDMQPVHATACSAEPKGVGTEIRNYRSGHLDPQCMLLLWRCAAVE